MAEPDQVERIRAYLEQHRYAYDRDMLRKQLLADGHAPENIDLAMARVYGFQVGSTQQATPATSNTRYVLAGIGVFLLNVFALPFVLSLLSGSVSFAIMSELYAAAMLAEIIAVAVLRRRNRPLARTLGFGVLGTIVPIALGLVLFGICVAMLRSA